MTGSRDDIRPLRGNVAGHGARQSQAWMKTERPATPHTPATIHPHIMKPISKTAACKQASSEISTVYPFGGQWRFSWYDAQVKANRESQPQNYHAATSARRIHLIERAREILHGEHHERQYYAGDCTGGKWQAYV